MANPNVAAANARLQADPRWQAAWQKYNSAMAAAPPMPTTAQQRASGEFTDNFSPERYAAQRELGNTFQSIVRDYQLPGQPQAWHIGANGQMGYEEDHSLRNNLLMMGSILALGPISAAVGGGAAPLASTQIGTGAIGPITGGTGLAGAGAGGAGAAGGAGSILGTAASLGPMVNPALAGAIPASAGGAVVPTVAPGLAGSLSAGSMIPSAATVPGAMTAAAGGPLVETLGTTAPLAGTLDTGTMLGTQAPMAANTPWWKKLFGIGQDVASRASAFEESRRTARDEASLAAYRQNLANEARFRSQLEAHRDALAAPQKRADNSLRGDRLANAQDIHIQMPSNIPDLQITGGFRPSMWSENTRQLGRQMSADALAGSGKDELTGPPMERSPEPNQLDTFLNTASLISAIPYRRQGRRVPQPGDSDYVG